MAQRLPATTDNYRKVIDRYFFVGILEHGQASVDTLARMINKHSRPLPWKNKTQKDAGIRHGREELPRESVARFRSDNALDYLIYDYCVSKFNKMPVKHTGT